MERSNRKASPQLQQNTQAAVDVLFQADNSEESSDEEILTMEQFNQKLAKLQSATKNWPRGLPKGVLQKDDWAQGRTTRSDQGFQGVQ